MTKKYRIRVSGRAKILEEFLPSRPKTKTELKKNSTKGIPGQMTKEKWTLEGYYRWWTDIIVHLLDEELIPIGDDLKSQLESFPQALENAVKKVMEELELPDER